MCILHANEAILMGRVADIKRPREAMWTAWLVQIWSVVSVVYESYVTMSVVWCTWMHCISLHWFMVTTSEELQDQMQRIQMTLFTIVPRPFAVATHWYKLQLNCWASSWWEQNTGRLSATWSNDQSWSNKLIQEYQQCKDLATYHVMSTFRATYLTS